MYEIDHAYEFIGVINQCLPDIEKTMDSFYGEPIYKQRAHEVQRNASIDKLREASDRYNYTKTPWAYRDSPEVFQKVLDEYGDSNVNT